jgi:hypothetical protein
MQHRELGKRKKHFVLAYRQHAFVVEARHALGDLVAGAYNRPLFGSM